jgi:hypothetical protein
LGISTVEPRWTGGLTVRASTVPSLGGAPLRIRRVSSSRGMADSNDCEALVVYGAGASRFKAGNPSGPREDLWRRQAGPFRLVVGLGRIETCLGLLGSRHERSFDAHQDRRAGRRASRRPGPRRLSAAAGGRARGLARRPARRLRRRGEDGRAMGRASRRRLAPRPGRPGSHRAADLPLAAPAGVGGADGERSVLPLQGRGPRAAAGRRPSAAGEAGDILASPVATGTSSRPPHSVHEPS